MATAAPIRWASFRIDELDCPDEVLLIRELLEGHPGIVQLEIDVFHHRLNVRYHPQQLTGEELVDKLGRAGMTAHPWEEDYHAPTPGVWQQHGRSWMTLVSAGFLLSGVISHVLAHLGDGLRGFLVQPPATTSIALRWEFPPLPTTPSALSSRGKAACQPATVPCRSPGHAQGKKAGSYCTSTATQ